MNKAPLWWHEEAGLWLAWSLSNCNDAGFLRRELSMYVSDAPFDEAMRGIINDRLTEMQ